LAGAPFKSPKRIGWDEIEQMQAISEWGVALSDFQKATAPVELT
jgi:hypothetical protein